MIQHCRRHPLCGHINILCLGRNWGRHSRRHIDCPNGATFRSLPLAMLLLLLLLQKFLLLWPLPFLFSCRSLLRLVISHAFTELEEVAGMFGLSPRLSFPSPFSSSLAVIDEGAGACKRTDEETGEDLSCQCRSA